MKPDRRIFIFTFFAFGTFLLLMCFGTYVESNVYTPESSLSSALFDSCVTALSFGSDLFNIDFRTINVLIFCLLVPLAFIGLLIHNLVLRSRLMDMDSDIYIMNRTN